MRKISYSTQFKKDYKRIIKQGLDEKTIKAFVAKLVNDEVLPESARPHKLSGEYTNMWDAHIAPDWILIYEIDENYLVLRRTGSHANLFR